MDTREFELIMGDMTENCYTAYMTDGRAFELEKSNTILEIPPFLFKVIKHGCNYIPVSQISHIEI